MKLYSSGQVAELLGVKRDLIQQIAYRGGPGASLRAGNRLAYTEDDVAAICGWLDSKSVSFTRPDFSKEEAIA